MRDLRLIPIGLLLIALGHFADNAVAKSKTKPKSDLYGRAVNDTLDMTLLVGGEWRAAHRGFTWQELQIEVVGRLKVKRVEPWNR